MLRLRRIFLRRSCFAQQRRLTSRGMTVLVGPGRMGGGVRGRRSTLVLLLAGSAGRRLRLLLPALFECDGLFEGVRRWDRAQDGCSLAGRGSAARRLFA